LVLSVSTPSTTPIVPPEVASGATSLGTEPSLRWSAPGYLALPACSTRSSARLLSVAASSWLPVGFSTFSVDSSLHHYE
jgi:hypothetical protein